MSDEEEGLEGLDPMMVLHTLRLAGMFNAAMRVVHRKTNDNRDIFDVLLESSKKASAEKEEGAEPLILLGNQELAVIVRFAAFSGEAHLKRFLMHSVRQVAAGALGGPAKDFTDYLLIMEAWFKSVKDEAEYEADREKYGERVINHPGRESVLYTLRETATTQTSVVWRVPEGPPPRQLVLADEKEFGHSFDGVFTCVLFQGPPN